MIYLVFPHARANPEVETGCSARRAGVTAIGGDAEHAVPLRGRVLLWEGPIMRRAKARRATIPILKLLLRIRRHVGLDMALRKRRLELQVAVIGDRRVSQPKIFELGQLRQVLKA